jgi:hypothetical protein
MSPILGIYASQISGHLFTLSGSYDALASVTVPSGGLSSITFAGIPTGYSHLQLRMSARGTKASSGDDIYLQFNGDTSSSGNYYGYHQLYGNGSSVSSNVSGATYPGIIPAYLTAANNMSNNFGASVLDILDYNSTNKNKVIKSLSGWDDNGSGYILLRSGMWQPSTPAGITSITLFYNSGGSFAQYTSIALYGVK